MDGASQSVESIQSGDQSESSLIPPSDTLGEYIMVSKHVHLWNFVILKLQFEVVLSQIYTW